MLGLRGRGLNNFIQRRWSLTHISVDGKPQMVDVGDKARNLHASLKRA